MANSAEKVLLRPIGGGNSQAFEPAHAKALLGLRGTVWESVPQDEPKKADDKGKPIVNKP